MDVLTKRKHPRHKEYDYSQEGAYFITICVENRRPLLGEVVLPESTDPNPPFVKLSAIGSIVQQHIEQIGDHYDVVVDNYVIMPNHLHLLIFVKDAQQRPSRPTMLIPNIIAALKKMTSREVGHNIWQRSYHDHIIRNEEDCARHWVYIDSNPAKWAEDDYYL